MSGERPSLLRRYLESPPPPMKKRGRAWQSLPKEERNAILIAERWHLCGPGKPNFHATAKVYFIQEPMSLAIKIGIAKDVADRLVKIQTSNPNKLVVLAECAGGLALERTLHAEFAADRLHGEWFKCTDRLLARVAELCGSR